MTGTGVAGTVPGSADAHASAPAAAPEDLRAVPATGDHGRLPGLDGLRAVAVLAVMLYHADLGWLPGGFLGVDVFFVISGFLITTLLLAERERLGHIRLRAFWLRRARRLLPALFLLLAATLTFAVVLAPDELSRLRGDTLAALGYVTNWYLILRQQSYFETIGRPSPLLHLWSLAVEEQFYVLWPLALAAGMALLRRRGMLAATLLGAAGSATLMALLYVPYADPSRVYYGTDTHAVGLLVGAALALAWTPRRSARPALPAPDAPAVGAAASGVPVAPAPAPVASGRPVAAASPAWSLPPWPEEPGAASAARPGPSLRARLAAAVRAVPWIDLAGVAGLVLLVVAFVQLDEYEPFLYQGGFVLLALVTAAVIVAAVHPRGRLGTHVLDRQPLRWIGERSYGIYLWHWPIFTFTRPGIDVPLDAVPDLALRFALTLVAAELSYRFVETPVRQGALGRAWARWRATPRRQRLVAFRLPIASSAAVLAVAVVVGTRVVAATPPPTPAYLSVTAVDTGGPVSGSGVSAVSAGSRITSGNSGATPEAPASPAADAGATAGASSGQPGESPAATGTPGTSAATPAPVVAARPPRVLAIGDSVMLGAVTQLRAAIHGIEVNAQVGRSFQTGIQILEARRKAGTLPPVVVVALGDNGWISGAQISQLMGVLKGTSLVALVNLKEPRDWESHDNAMLAAAAKQYPNVIVVDWHDASIDHPEYFWDDLIHLRPTGAVAYARVLASALAPALSPTATASPSSTAIPTDGSGTISAGHAPAPSGPAASATPAATSPGTGSPTGITPAPSPAPVAATPRPSATVH